MDISEDVLAGQAVYTDNTLALYDLVVLGVSNGLIWRCPTRRLVEMYDRNLTQNHLDVGVGTGFFLDRARFPGERPRIALMDLNERALAFAARRIARYRPETYVRNVLAPIPFEGAKFDSVAANYLLHCLPGDMAAKAAVFDHLKALMNPGAVLFGSTLLQAGVPRGFAARRLMAFYNRKRIFSNEHDDADALLRALGARFEEVAFEIVGCAAVFSARAPRS